ncbi:uncharacterized protein [Pocillopora verrucosa]|uniref:uncharacterized protein isoform X2 n=1 Tax=Pocillopora verrucosa TaxID=203993 RepID=UPI003341E428
MNTTDFGWPMSSPVKTVDSKIFLDARKGLSPFGYFNEKQCKKGAYKQIEEMLKQYGLTDNDIYLDRNSRSFISAEALILIVIAGNKLRDPGQSAEQFSWASLCLFFARTVVNSTFSREIAAGSGAGSVTTSKTQNVMLATETFCTQGSCTNVPQLKVFTGCIKPPESTSTLAGRLANGQTSRSTKLEERIKKQSKILSHLALEVHYGSKIDLLHGISLSVGRRFRQQCSIDSAWQGQLEKQDIILLTKLIRTKTGDSLYNQIGEEQATVQIPPSAILKLQDQCNSGQTIDEIRKILPPGYLATKRKVAELKTKYKLEFEAIMQPQRTATGYRIEPARLVECLHYLYYWLPKEQWWHLYGDGRKYGKKDTVMIAISNVNNEQKLNGIKFQSPKEMWPIHIFHHKDSRRNLELNIGDGHGGPGYLNEWIKDSQNLGH